MAVAFGIRNDESHAREPQTVEIPYTDSLLTGKNVFLETQAAEECVVVVVAAVYYSDGNRRIREEGYEPVEVVGSICENLRLKICDDLRENKICVSKAFL